MNLTRGRPGGDAGDTGGDGAGARTGPSRLTALCAALLVPELLVLAYGLAGRVVGQDFAVFHAASGLLHAGRAGALTDPAALGAAAEALLGRPLGAVYPWPYPPTALLLVWPLALAPVWPAYVAAMAIGIAAYLGGAIWLAGWRREHLLVLLAFPAVPITIIWGHVSFLTTALLASALAALPVSPVLAGLAVGLLTFKPHLGILVPVALLAERRWTALATSACTAVALAGAATLAFGWEPWVSFRQAAPAMLAMVEQEAATKPVYQSVFSAVRLAGGGTGIAALAQGIAAAAAAWAVWRTWSGGAPREVKGIVLALGTLVATPYLCEYDLLLLGIPVALALRSPATWRWPWTAAALLVPVLARPLAQLAHVAVVPGVAVALLGTTLRYRGPTQRAPHLGHT